MHIVYLLDKTPNTSHAIPFLRAVNQPSICKMVITKLILFAAFLAFADSNLLFDYGVLRGNDVIGEVSFGECSNEITLETPLRFFNTEYDSLLVSIYHSDSLVSIIY